MQDGAAHERFEREMKRMRVLVTGASGFVGQKLLAALAPAHEVVALDTRAPGAVPASVAFFEGDLRDNSLVDAAIGNGVDAVVHLATIPGGGAEQDPTTAFSVNVAASVNLLSRACDGRRPRIVFASSIAIFGENLPPCVDDGTPARPRMVYGAHKLMMEQWLATMSRRGSCEAISLRIPGIVARPSGPSGMKSAFLSDVFHALSAGRRFVSPVSPTATTWLMSGSKIVENLWHGLFADGPFGEPYAITLPAVRTSMQSLVAEIARQADRDPSLVEYEPDPLLEAGFGNQPELMTPAADRTGFSSDGTLVALVRRVLSDLE